jgi:hypothetical protein
MLNDADGQGSGSSGGQAREALNDADALSDSIPLDKKRSAMAGGSAGCESAADPRLRRY